MKNGTSDPYHRNFHQNRAQCGCCWTRDPHYGDVLRECLFHKAVTAASLGEKSTGSYLDQIAQRIGNNCGMSLAIKDDATLLRIYAVLCLATGEETTCEDVHNAWVAAKGASPHRSAVPFFDLDYSTQKLDEPFRLAIIDVARELASKPHEPSS